MLWCVVNFLWNVWASLCGVVAEGQFVNVEFVNKWYFNFVVQEAFDTQKKRQVDVDVLLLIRIVVVDHFVVIFFYVVYIHKWIHTIYNV